MHSSTRDARRAVGAPHPMYRDPVRGTRPRQHPMGTHLFTALEQRLSRGWLVAAVVAASLTVALLMLLAPHVGMIVLLVALLLVSWHWMQRELALRDLTAQIARGEVSKLEVSHGAWGALCHAVNGLVQRQRLLERSTGLLPTLPPDLMRGLLEERISAGPTPYAATVLLVGCGRAATAEQWAMLASLAQGVATPQSALVQRCGDGLLLVFGLGRQSATTPGLRSALEAVLALQAGWQARSQTVPLTVGLAAGPLVAGSLPGLGYGVAGQTVARAQALYGFAAAHPEVAALCDEETYVALRQLQVRTQRVSDSAPLYGVVAERRS